MASTSAEEPPVVVDDKSAVCIQFILDRLRADRELSSSSSLSSLSTAAEAGAGAERERERPFIVGLNGVQGVGKTTLVRTIAAALRDVAGLETLVVSIDDLYLTHADQRALAAAHPDNKLVQVRGEPGTHDMDLAARFFDALCAGLPVRVPQYDKSAHAGQGDRVPEAQWAEVNGPGQRRVQVVVIEGWCVGFRRRPAAEVAAARERAIATEATATADASGSGSGSGDSLGSSATTQLGRHRPEHLQLVNAALGAYDAAVTDRLDTLVHVDAEDARFAYGWRLEQERALRRARGAAAAMADDEVARFIDAYFPAYELYLDRLRAGLFGAGKPGRQLRLVVGPDRRVRRTVLV
ncbi:P-loop containing nucleoside triphosphate hydrolase protein [Xylariaceae sp. FL0804]|nr:P-loop containing nucleoside triphosphate hydrolase protein [Xylariaceae sp. FL0804]